uniref:Uncharacterized protein n=1 Tax=Seriola dumerili TaxID=41447 RepID=A0A3B4VQI6_SERDU
LSTADGPAGSPSSSAGLCRPARSPGKAGRSRAPGAPSYSNMCFQTEEGTNNRGEQKRFQSDHQLSDPGSCTVCPGRREGGREEEEEEGGLTHEHPHTPGTTQRLQADRYQHTHKQRVTHHITNGGDVSDSHLVYSVPLAAIFIK